MEERMTDLRAQSLALIDRFESLLESATPADIDYLRNCLSESFSSLRSAALLYAQSLDHGALRHRWLSDDEVSAL